MTLRLYDYGASGNCYKVRLLLAQLERPYERIPVDIFGGDTLTDAFAAKNPARTTPVLEVGDGRLLPESNAILVYLAESTPFLPDDPFDRAQVLRWLIYEQTDVIPTIAGLRFRLHTRRLAETDEDAVRRKVGGEEVLRLLDRHLAERTYFVGERYTVADVAMYGYLHVAHEARIDTSPYEAVSAWLARVERQPRYVHDLEPYPANAMRGASHSIYDSAA